MLGSGGDGVSGSEQVVVFGCKLEYLGRRRTRTGGIVLYCTLIMDALMVGIVSIGRTPNKPKIWPVSSLLFKVDHVAILLWAYESFREMLHKRLGLCNQLKQYCFSHKHGKIVRSSQAELIL